MHIIGGTSVKTLREEGQVTPLVFTDYLVELLPSISSQLYISGPPLVYY